MNNTLIDDLVSDITTMQYAANGKYGFHKGMFYSYKKYAGFPQRITPDNNIFFTCLIAFTLKNLLPDLNEENKNICKTIISSAVTAYPFYQNKDRLPAYFFWETKKPILPNTYLIQHLTKFIANPEDIDDTVMILSTMNADDATVNKFRTMMESVANGQLHQIKNTYKKYRKIPAHSTYLGHKWQVDFDFCVHCNALYFLLERKIPFNKYDNATLDLITNMVANREYITDAKYISAYYIFPAILIYHLSRLMSTFTLQSLEPYRSQIIEDINILLNKKKNIMHDLILNTSLLRLGAESKMQEIETLDDLNKIDTGEFIYFQARAGSQFNDPFKRLIMNCSIFNYHFFSPAFNKVLWLEYFVEKNKMNAAKA